MQVGKQQSLEHIGMIKYTQEESYGFTNLKHEKKGAHSLISLYLLLGFFVKVKIKNKHLMPAFPFHTNKHSLFERKGVIFFLKEINLFFYHEKPRSLFWHSIYFSDISLHLNFANFGDFPPPGKGSCIVDTTQNKPYREYYPCTSLQITSKLLTSPLLIILLKQNQ